MRLIDRSSHADTTGFTLIELITGFAVIGLAFAITAPSYQSWAHKQRLKSANDEMLSLLHQTKRIAIQKKQSQQLSLREIGNQVEWSRHPVNTPAITWKALPRDVQIDPETTLRRRRGNYILQFNDYGEINGQLGRLTLSLTQQPEQKRCIMISTLLGKIRQGKMHRRPKRGRYCY